MENEKMEKIKKLDFMMQLNNCKPLYLDDLLCRYGIEVVDIDNSFKQTIPYIKSKIWQFLENNKTLEDLADMYIVAFDNHCELWDEWEFNDNVVTCNDCDCYILKDDSIYVYRYGYCVCDKCCNKYYNYCERCDELTHIDDLEESVEGNLVCDDCYNNGNCYRCNECGRIICYEDNTYFHNGECYCCNCYSANNNGLDDYHHGNRDWKILTSNNDNKNAVTYGFELETEYNYDIFDFDCNQLKHDFDFISCLEKDGSLSDDGMEIISHPFTSKWLWENMENIKNMMSFLTDNNFTSHDNGRCGLHFHVGGLNEEEKNKLFEFIEYNYNIFYKFARRNRTTYCSKYFDNDLLKNKSAKQRLDFCKDCGYGSHSYHFIKDSNNNTCEIRIFRGTLRFNTFATTFDLVQALVKTVKENKIVTFKKVMKNIKDIKNFADYVAKQNIDVLIRHANKEVKRRDVLTCV